MIQLSAAPHTQLSETQVLVKRGTAYLLSARKLTKSSDVTSNLHLHKNPLSS